MEKWQQKVIRRHSLGYVGHVKTFASSICPDKIFFVQDKIRFVQDKNFVHGLKWVSPEQKWFLSCGQKFCLGQKNILSWTKSFYLGQIWFCPRQKTFCLGRWTGHKLIIVFRYFSFADKIRHTTLSKYQRMWLSTWNIMSCLCQSLQWNFTKKQNISLLLQSRKSMDCPTNLWL